MIISFFSKHKLKLSLVLALPLFFIISGHFGQIFDVPYNLLGGFFIIDAIPIVFMIGYDDANRNATDIDLLTHSIFYHFVFWSPIGYAIGYHLED